ncbi:MAG: hypothetical protein AVDCRST_MAG96-1725 [uncultured Segetibacter sp.]|uniref:Uncharacterized protein n=1 Tax=uncultured Segetibacter sp. TaxID=481133 RepID=A0A6J4SCT9_9BACT|nr:MAG: hypothetical protein AVDCRST_MAG96-1725 [uncultured Segetibacter sp.]
MHFTIIINLKVCFYNLSVQAVASLSALSVANLCIFLK